MDLRHKISIDASAARVWAAIGERFMHIAEWAAPIPSSCPVGPEEPALGAARACSNTPFGPIKAGIVTERLLNFDRNAMTFEYEAIEGMPSFIAQARSRWSVEAVDEDRSVVRIHANVSLRGVARFFTWPMTWQLQAAGARVAEELKYFVEHGRPHPRKQRAKAASARNNRPIPDQGSAGHPSR